MKRFPLEALRVTGLLVAIAGFGLLATGCSLRKTPSTSTSKQIQIRIWRLGQSNDTLKNLQTQFTKAHPTVNITYRRKSADDYELAALKSLAAQNGPDIWSIPDDWLWDHEEHILPLPADYYTDAKTKKSIPANEQVKTLYPQGIVDQITDPSNDQVYGVPTSVDVLQLYVNQDLLSQALSDFRTSQGSNLDQAAYAEARQALSKPPVTWSDVLNQTKYVTLRDGNNITRSTIAFGSSDNIPNAADILQLLMLQNGAKITSADRRNALFHIPASTPSGGQVSPGQNALDFFTSFSNPTKDNYSWNASMPEALDAFGQGKVAMVVAFSDFGAQLKIKYPKFQFSVAPVPQISASPVQPTTNLIRFSVETVTKTADNSAAAFAFLKTYTDSSDVISVARDQKLTSPFLTTLQQRKTEFPFAQILSGTAVYKKNRLPFDAAFRQMITDVSQNGLTSQDALTKGADTINVLLTEARNENE